MYSLLVAKHLLTGEDKWHALCGEYSGLCEKIKTNKLVLGDAWDACLQTVNETHVVVAADIAYHLSRRVGPRSFRVVHLCYVNLRMIYGSRNAKLDAFFVACYGTEEG